MTKKLKSPYKIIVNVGDIDLLEKGLRGENGPLVLTILTCNKIDKEGDEETWKMNRKKVKIKLPLNNLNLILKAIIQELERRDKNCLKREIREE